jgi:hypothetical protein
VPHEWQIRACCGLGRGLLVAVLADVDDSQLGEQPNVRCGKGLGHGDDGDLTRVAPGRGAGMVDACPYRGEIRP